MGSHGIDFNVGEDTIKPSPGETVMALTPQQETAVIALIANNVKANPAMVALNQALANQAELESRYQTTRETYQTTFDAAVGQLNVKYAPARAQAQDAVDAAQAAVDGTIPVNPTPVPISVTTAKG